jgi:hypothetical protein
MRNPLAALILILLLFVCAARGTGEPQISTMTNIPTYIAGNNWSNTGAGDIICIYGSATKTVFVNEVHGTGISSTAITIAETMIKRSSQDTGGVSSGLVVVPLNSSNPAATATVTFYTTSPTPGATVGTIDSRYMALGNLANTAAFQEVEADFGDLSDQPITLHGVNEGVCVNVSAGGTGTFYSFHIRWMEQ